MIEICDDFLEKIKIMDYDRRIEFDIKKSFESTICISLGEKTIPYIVSENQTNINFILNHVIEVDLDTVPLRPSYYIKDFYFYKKYVDENFAMDTEKDPFGRHQFLWSTLIENNGSTVLVRNGMKRIKEKNRKKSIYPKKPLFGSELYTNMRQNLRRVKLRK
jgi:hypothetical protein